MSRWSLKGDTNEEDLTLCLRRQDVIIAYHIAVLMNPLKLYFWGRDTVVGFRT